MPRNKGGDVDREADLDRGDVEVVSKDIGFRGYFTVERYRLRHRLFAGGWSDEVPRELLQRGHAVGALLYDPDRDRVVLVEQFRIGAYGAGMAPWLLEIPAGIIEDGESPEDVVRREAKEEAGLDVGILEPVAHYLSTPGACSETVRIFCGRVDAANAGGIHGLDEEHEDIRVVVMSPEALFERLDAGAIDNSMTLIAVQWFRHHHARLRRTWTAAD